MVFFTHFQGRITHLKNNWQLKHHAGSSEACKNRSQSLYMQIERMPSKCVLSPLMLFANQEPCESQESVKRSWILYPARSPLIYVNTCSFYSLLTFNLPVVHFYSFCSFAIQQDSSELFERTDSFDTGGNLEPVPVPAALKMKALTGFPCHVFLNLKMNLCWLFSCSVG